MLKFYEFNANSAYEWYDMINVIILSKDDNLHNNNVNYALKSLNNNKWIM